MDWRSCSMCSGRVVRCGRWLIKKVDRTLAELESLADAPDLAENAREERLAAEQALRRGQQDLKDADLELTRCAAELSALVIEQPLLDHAEAVERLAAGAEAAARSRIEVQQQQAVIERIESEIAETAARIALGTDIKQVLNAVPSAADRVALDSHLRATSLLEERLSGFRKRAQELHQAAEPDEVDATGAPDPKSRKAVADALRQAQALGDVGRKLPEHDRELGELNGRLGQALSDLRIATLDGLRNARPLLDAEIVSNRKSLTDLDETVRAAGDEDVRLERDLEQQQLRQRELAAEGEVVTAETLRLARDRRDQGWTAIRQAYVERTRDAEELARAFDPSRPLPEAFEAAQGDADRQADLLRADARRAAGFEECSTRIETMDKRRQAIVAELAQIGIRREEITAAWSRKLAEAGLPRLDADALREWQPARLGALEIAERRAKVQAERDRLHADISAAITDLKVALQAVGQPPQGDSVGSLIEQAARWDKHVTEAEADRRARLRVERERKAEKARIDGQIVQTDAELREHLLAVQASHARLFLPAGSAPETVKARLDELDELVTQAAHLNGARERQAHHQAVVDDVSHQAARIASVLGEPVPDLITDFAARLRTRLAASREQDQQRIALTRDRDRAQETKRRAQSELEFQTGTLARLCAAAGVDAAEKLSDREDAAARKRKARSTLATQREQLARASKRSEEELRERLAGQDAVAMESELDRCRIDIGEKEKQQASAREAEEQARRALEAIDASDRAAAAREAMESAAARFRGAVRPWARLRLAHALLQEALNRFRERAQAPMVAAASTYFSLMTGGRYERLEVDEEGDTPVLRAVQGDGARKGIEAMSDGTSDQLYLALRLAALDLRRASDSQMPLILDDVLITSDDERSANILRALARFAEGSQVMIFTHHQHLIDVARTALSDQGLAIHTLCEAPKA